MALLNPAMLSVSDGVVAYRSYGILKVMTERIAVIGASEHARVVADIVKSVSQFSFVGFIDNAKSVGAEVEGARVLGPDTHIRSLQTKYGMDAFAIGVGDNSVRSKIVTKLSTQGFMNYVSLVHPAAHVSDSAKIGAGAVVCAGACVGIGASVGDHAIINTHASVDHDARVGCYASVAPGSVMGGASSLGDYSALCIGAVVTHGVAVGKNTVVGAGSVVLKSVDDDLVVYGCPAKKIRQRRFGDAYL